MNKNKSIFIVAGETSGDIHGAQLVQAIKKFNPETKLSGAGGRLMQSSGVNLYYNLVDLSVVGFWEVVRNLRKFTAIFKSLSKKLDEANPDAVILIDYPGFNLRFAREARKRKIKIIYYISPQVWAWGKRRIALIKKLVDRMIVLFKFEEELYKSHGVDAKFVGHPLLDIVKPSLAKAELLNKFNLSAHKKTIALLPGSRTAEIKRHLPLMLKTAQIIIRKMPEAQFVLSQSANLREKIFSSCLKTYSLKLTPIKNNYDCIEIADCVIVASGTATLETAILGTPMVIIYKTSFLTWILAKPQIKIPYIGLVNVVAGKKIVPEFIQYGTGPGKIAKAVIDILRQPKKQQNIKDNLIKVKEKLGMPGASARAAKMVLSLL